jgi:CheY-like chemotaxis protein
MTGTVNKNAKKRLLIIDDEADTTASLAFTLGSLFAVDTCNEPMQVLATFKPRMYDLVLIDFRMSQMNGIELLEIIRKTDPKVKILIMTSYEIAFLHKRCQNSTTLEYLIAQDQIIRKPFGKSELLAKLNKVLEVALVPKQ